MIKKIWLSLVLLLIVVGPVQAQVVLPEPELVSEEEASFSGSPSGIVENIVEKKPDLTEPEGEVKSKLEKVLEDNPVEELKWNNFLQYTIFQAVKRGVPVNTLVLLLLFPVVVAIVAGLRHIIGIMGLGILTPSLLAVAFLATGIGPGVLLFVVIFAVATFARMALRKLKLQYLPRMALLLWFVSFGVFATFLISSMLDFEGIATVGIFPILILMLLAETFIDVQIGRSTREASSLILSTFLTAITISYVIGAYAVQRVVLLYPELVFIGVGLFDVFMGKYVGLRVMEYLKFRPLFTNRDQEE